MSNGNVLIIGASKGIGRALTKKFIEEGCSVIAVSRNMQNLAVLKDEMNNSSLLEVIEADITNPEHQEHIIKTATHKNKIDYLIHCAAVLEPTGKEGTIDAEKKNIIWKRMFGRQLSLLNN